MDPRPAPLTSPDLGRSPLALLVDRDVDTRKMYAEYLRLSVCDIDEADDGREALAMAIAHHPDVIITETRLPGINGFDLCRLLREVDARNPDCVRHWRCVRHRRQARRNGRCRFRARQTVSAGAPRQRNPPAAARLTASARAGTRGSRQDLRSNESISGSAQSLPADISADPAQPRAQPARHARSSRGAAGAHVSGVRSSADVRSKPHRRRQRTSRRAMGLLRLRRRVWHLPVPAADAQAAPNR